MKDVLFVPELQHSLLAINQLTTSSDGLPTGAVYVTGQHAGSSTLTLQSGASIPCTFAGGLFWLVPDAAVTAFTATTTTPIPFKLFHQRMGHLNHADLRAVAKQLEVKLGPCNDKLCHTCALSKSRRANISRTRQQPSATTPGATIRADMTGPFPPTETGHSFALHVMDEATRYSFMYLLQRKSDAPEAFARFVMEFNILPKVHAATISTTTTTTVYTDSDAVFQGAQFKRVLQASGATASASPPHRPEQNSLEERHLATIVSTARTILLHSQLPTTFYGHALRHATTIRNASPTKGLRGLTPFAALTGKMPIHVTALRVFGSTAYVHVARPSKLEASAFAGVYIGHDITRNAPLVLNSDTRATVASVDIRLAESVTKSTTQISDTDFDEQTGHNESNIASLELNELDMNGNDDNYSSILPDTTQQPLQQQPLHQQPHSLMLYNSPSPNNPRDPDYIPSDDDFSDALSVMAFAVSVSSGSPSSRKAAMAGPDAEQWLQAEQREQDALESMGCYQPVPAGDMPPEVRPMRSRFIYKVKDREIPIRYKARLVVDGSVQETSPLHYASVAGMKTVRAFLANSARRSMPVYSFDITNAFVNADLPEAAYIHQPQGMNLLDLNGGRAILKLKKSLYGLRCSPHHWQLLLHEWLQTVGFQRSLVEPCLYTRNNNNHIEYLLTFVDDLFLSTTSTLAAAFGEQLLARFNARSLGELTNCLGIEIKFSDKSVTLSQKAFIEEIIVLANLPNVTARSMPLPNMEHLRQASPQPLSSDRVSFYRKIVGSLLYLSIATRPDCAFAASSLARHMHSPTQLDLSHALHTVRYLIGTSDYELTYNFSNTNNSTLTAFCDADFASDLTSQAKSTTGFALFWGGAALTWKSELQNLTATSTCEAEFLAIFATVREGLFVRQLLSALGCHQQTTTIFSDSQSAIQVATTPQSTKRCKHYDASLFRIRDHIANNDFTIKYVPTDTNISDINTKVITGIKTAHFSDVLLGRRP